MCGVVDCVAGDLLQRNIRDMLVKAPGSNTSQSSSTGKSPAKTPWNSALALNLWDMLSQLYSRKDASTTGSSHPVVARGKILSIPKPDFSSSERACSSFDFLRYLVMLSSSADFLAAWPVMSR